MLPKLETLEAYCCKGRARIKKGEGQVPETIFSDVKNASSLLIQRDVDLSFCHAICYMNFLLQFCLACTMSQIYPLIKAASQFFLHASTHVTL
jgi:hypothetical protein